MGRTYQSISIKAPIKKVWSTVKNFHNMSWAPNLVTKIEAVGETDGETSGAKRILNDAFHETLHEINENEYEIIYSIDEGPSPVSSNEIKNYRGLLKLRPISIENSTFVEWTSAWENNDAAAHEFCHGIYVALLNEMKASLE